VFQGAVTTGAETTGVGATQVGAVATTGADLTMGVVVVVTFVLTGVVELTLTGATVETGQVGADQTAGLEATVSTGQEGALQVGVDQVVGVVHVAG
jgi:hypothetical protein